MSSAAAVGRVPDIVSVTPKHKEYHCAIHDYDTDDKATFLQHISELGHYEYGHITCSICGGRYTVPKVNPIPAVLFRTNKTGGTAAAHPECWKSIGIGIGA
jgi:hypothetical protein